MLYKDYIRCPSDNKLQKFKAYRNGLHGLIRKSKRSFYFNKFEQVKNNMCRIWKTINNLIGRTQKQSQTDRFKGNSGTIITDPNKIANEFNDFFVNIGPKLEIQKSNTMNILMTLTKVVFL